MVVQMAGASGLALVRQQRPSFALRVLSCLSGASSELNELSASLHVTDLGLSPFTVSGSLGSPPPGVSQLLLGVWFFKCLKISFHLLERLS